MARPEQPVLSVPLIVQVGMHMHGQPVLSDRINMMMNMMGHFIIPRQVLFALW